MPTGRPKDESTLSRNAAQTRRRLRRAAKEADKTGDASRLHREMRIYHEATIGDAEPFKPVEEWSFEELARGRPRLPGGGWRRGKTPGWITTEILRESQRRVHERVLADVTVNALDAIKVIKKLMTSEDLDDKGRPIVDAGTKLKAATLIVEYVLGKPKAIGDVGAVDQARQMFAAAIVLDDGLPQGHLQPAIEGEIVEDAEIED